MDPRGFPTSLPEFQQVFPNDAACVDYMERLKWPGGFACPKCGVIGEPYRVKTRPHVLKCRDCHANIGLTAGTVMQKSHMPLATWFWGAYLVTTQTPGQSALQFQRQLGLSRYETAFQILHKLRAGMVRPTRDPIGGEHAVELDETLVGGRTRGEGRGKHHKVYVIAAVEARFRKGGEDRSAAGERDDHRDGRPLKQRVYAGRLRMKVVSDRKAATCERFARDNVLPGSKVRTDGWQGYDKLRPLGFEHHALAMDADHELEDEHLPMVHLVFSNFKTWLLGTHHGVSQQHLQAYCNEYTFRFNRRFYPATTFNSLLGLAAKTIPPTYEALYSGEWKHPGPAPLPPQVEMPFA